MTNDLEHFLLDALYLFGGIATLLFILSAVDPQTGRTELARPKAPHRAPSPRPGPEA